MYRAFSYDITVAILVFHNNDEAVITVYRANFEGFEIFRMGHYLLFQRICKAAGHVSESALYPLLFLI